MSMYHCHISNVSRAKGSSAIASLSYITATKIIDQRIGQQFCYGRQERVVAYNTLLPPSAPAEWADGAVLFNAIELHEKAQNARTAKKIEVALPVEFSTQQRKAVVENFIKDTLCVNGYAASYAIHEDKEGKNPHCHILVANRAIKNGKWANKQTMEYVLDDKGERVPLLNDNGEQKTDKRGRKQWKRRPVEKNWLDTKESLNSIRATWAECCNKELAPESQITHKSYADRNIDTEPTFHEGYKARALAKEIGRDKVEVCAYNDEIFSFREIKQKIKDLKNELTEAIKESAKKVEKAVESSVQLLHFWFTRGKKYIAEGVFSDNWQEKYKLYLDDNDEVYIKDTFGKELPENNIRAQKLKKALSYCLENECEIKFQKKEKSRLITQKIANIGKVDKDRGYDIDL